MNETMIKNTTKQPISDHSKPKIWDCDSSLYDSFELKEFEKQLSSAIASRTMSMDRRLPPPPPPQEIKKPSSKISRSIHRLVRAVFRPKTNNHNDRNDHSMFGGGFWRQNSKEGFYVVYDKSGALSTIPEVPEFDGVSPEMRSLVRKTASDRFSVPTSLGISCA